VTTVLLSGAVSLVIAILGTRLVITVLGRRKLGQQVRIDGPQAHLTKSGTPTMGGIVIIIASVAGYVAGHVLTGDPVSASGVLVLLLMTVLGVVGFIDDFIKLFMRRSLGLRSGAKLAGQAAAGCCDVRDPLDAAVVAAVAAGACFGFLWWNVPPAGIFMGDTGSLALGGALAGLAIVTRTDLLLPVLGGLFVIIALSVVIQVGSYKLRRKRVFKMAPLQHHFELAGWSETTIVVRFWLISGMFVALGLWIFYAA
jgi:UDP-N-acetylmuramyl pentapeptide phosphotransferase/UDP-N-acetylglucosamine-1-phosphate transferase